MTVTVVGAGVVGLSCAVRLAEAGHRVRVIAREPPQETTSAVAAAVWFPYDVGPLEKLEAWAPPTYRELARLAASEPESGVVMREMLSVYRTRTPAPWWSAEVERFREARPEELPSAEYTYGWVASVPVAETPRYLPWLERRLRLTHAVEVERRTVKGLAEVAAGTSLIVNCSGLDARVLAIDRELKAHRGQVVVVENPGLERVVVDEDARPHPTYVIPRRDDCVLGGTNEEGVESVAPNAEQTRDIRERTRRLVPELARAATIGARVGLRPWRERARLERGESIAGTPVIHCYGYGGAGHTVAWGCAAEVALLARQMIGTA